MQSFHTTRNGNAFSNNNTQRNIEKKFFIEFRFNIKIPPEDLWICSEFLRCHIYR